MNKDEALDLALEALEYFSDTSPTMAGKAHAEDAIAAIKQALAAPVQEPYAWHYKNAAGVSAWHFGPSNRFDADLDAAKQWPRTHQLIPVYTTPPAAPMREPVHQWRQKHSPYWYDGYPDNDDGGGPYETRTLYTTPPAAPVQEPLSELEKDAANLLFALRDAWPYVHGHCTIESRKKAIQALMVKHGDFADLHPPAAQRQWVGLTDDERGKVYADWRWSDGRTSNLALCEAIEAKLKEKNT